MLVVLSQWIRRLAQETTHPLPEPSIGTRGEHWFLSARSTGDFTPVKKISRRVKAFLPPKQPYPLAGRRAFSKNEAHASSARLLQGG